VVIPAVEAELQHGMFMPSIVSILSPDPFSLPGFRNAFEFAEQGGEVYTIA
jgi:hypothetical protein